ncbi:site-specific integrase [Brachybacterium huguangmaarense]|uniref:Site-specific integrase n=1 Tax=Brachybacterium huguangmaarense TaxID=1652028 RepID=A0ABY6FYE6_9MICO|nr:site-specific integrase [Brachybacterium huguangmaarense]UYG15641.1 site-specific integrase [Brachybacterium huguangmaarense]
MSSIRKRPDGRWRARYRDEAGKEHARHFRRKLDAQRWLDETTTSIVSGMYVDPRAGKITFNGFYREWAGRQVWTDSTRGTADQAVESVPFGGVPLSKIRRAHVEDWVKSMSVTAGERKALAPSTITTRFSYVSMALRGAVRDKRIAVDPSEGVKLPRRRRADQAMQIPTTEQVRAALDAAPKEYRALVAVCAFAGLRLGEAAGLQLADIDFLRRTLRVQRQIQGANVKTAKVVPPKAGSERTIAIPKALADELAAHVTEIGTMKSFFFFRGPDPLNRNSAAHIWREIRKAAKLPSAYTLHTLRHFYASALISSGCDVVTVQRALGHSTPAITLNVYSHLWPSAEDRTRTAAADLMTAVLDPAADSVRTTEQNPVADLGS